MAAVISRRICRAVIRQLQAAPSDHTRDILPHLRTAWDEVCLQVQGQESIHWDAYIDDIDLRLLGEIELLSPLERDCLWLTTDAGWDWSFDDVRTESDPPTDVHDILSPVRSELLSMAADWTNPALRAQQDADGQRYLEDH